MSRKKGKIRLFFEDLGGHLALEVIVLLIMIPFAVAGDLIFYFVQQALGR